MLKNKLQNLTILAGVLLLQPMVNPGSFAFAKKKTPMKSYSFITEGGKASQGECDGEKKVPHKLKHLKEYAKAGSYLGSELQIPELKGKSQEEMWKHFFRAKPACNVVLAKTPSSIEASKKDTKAELPPDDSADSGSDDQSDGPDSE
ncbi:MAG: hypothetical protein ACM3MG_07510 [Bacillota bacterium]